MPIDLGYDEGGDNRDHLLVSVQVGITDQAKKLKKSWIKCLPDTLPYFHAKDFGNYSAGVFAKAGLGRRERVKLLADLCKIIHRHLICGITVHIKISEYESLTTQDFRSRHGTAYGFAVDLCMLGAYHIVKEQGMKPNFNILIEDGHRNANQVVQILTRLSRFPDQIRRYPSEDVATDLKILTAGLGQKKANPILQGADMLAYSAFQRHMQGDATIWEALHRRDIPYRLFEAHCDEKLIKAFVRLGDRRNIWGFWKKISEQIKQDA